MRTVVGEDEYRVSQLLVDETHPFFFDHPVDHVPASLLIAGLLELVEPLAHAHTPLDRRRARLRLSVPKMAEHGVSTALSAQRPTGTGRNWSVRVSQDDTLIADGALEFYGEVPGAEPVGAVGNRPAGAQRNLVHRHRSENVMVGHPQLGEEWLTAPLRLPATDHYLSLRSTTTGSIETLLEGGRQFGIAYGHLVQRRHADAQMLLLGVGADVPVVIAPHTAVTLRARVEPVKGSRGRLVITYLNGGPGGAEFGEMSLEYVVVSAGAYRRMRGTKVAS